MLRLEASRDHSVRWSVFKIVLPLQYKCTPVRASGARVRGSDSTSTKTRLRIRVFSKGIKTGLEIHRGKTDMSQSGVRLGGNGKNSTFLA